MNYGGWAFSNNEKEQSNEIHDRFLKLKPLLGGDIIINRNSSYGHVDFNGKLLTEEAKSLSEMDLLILADYGNLCFGGSCSIEGDEFSGQYHTD